MTRSACFMVVWCLISSLVSVVHAEQITTGSLVREMVELRRLADFPDPAYKTVQFSSYDHRSTVPGGARWFANSDGFGREPVPNFEAVLREPEGDTPGEYLICDVEGPGAVVRTWTAAIGGDLRVYLDGEKKPLYEGPAEAFLWRSYGTFAQAAGIDAQIFEGTFTQRYAGYYPIPFAKRCRMVWTGDAQHVHFYQIQMRLYDRDAWVKTFSPADLKQYREDIERTTRILGDIDHQWQPHSTEPAVAFGGQIEPGKTTDLLQLQGPGAIECLTVHVSADDLDRALRQTILHVQCDDYDWGHVQCPIGDFFGAGPGINPYDSLPFTVRPDGRMTCRFVMPFAQSLRIRFQNRGEQPVKVDGSVLPVDYSWNDETSMYFRARWRIDHDLDGSGLGGVQDMPYLIANGGGVYVGSATMLLNPNNIPSSGGNWWGEGDEKVFVDDDIRPSVFGTGSEDYYNYAWSSVDIFVHPYCGQPRNDGPANRGFVTNNRWHILDPLPFRSRFAFYMELFTHVPTPGMSYARIGYHYARPGLIDDHLAITGEDVRHLELPADWQPVSHGGAANARFYQAEELSLNKDHVRFVADNLWSGGRLMVWQPQAIGEELAFRIPVEENRKHVIVLTAAKTPDSGRFSARLGGERIMGGETGIVDLHVPFRTLSRCVWSDKVELTKGDHELKLRYEGPSAGSKDTIIGIDFIWVKKSG